MTVREAACYKEARLGLGIDIGPDPLTAIEEIDEVMAASQEEVLALVS
jgi:hypothetical protein